MCGIPVGMLLGVLSAKGIFGAVLNQLSPEMFLAQDTAQLERPLLKMLLANGASCDKYRGHTAVSLLAAAPAAHFAGKSLSCGSHAQHHTKSKEQEEN